MSLKAQSAVEYLMTYGWMLLVLAIVGGAVFSVVDDQSIERVQGFESSQMAVGDFGMTNSGLRFNLVNRGGGVASIEEVLISTEMGNTTVPISKEVPVREGLTLNLPYLVQSSETGNVDIGIQYSMGGLTNVSIEGSLTGGFQFDDSMVGYWTLSPEQGNQTHAFDISQNDDHGDISGINYTQDGRFGEVMNFDGESKISLSGDRGSGKTSDLTVSTWAKANESGWILGEGALFRLNMDPGGEAGWWIREEDFGSSNMISGGEVDSDQWHHFVGVYDSSTGEQRLYVDGEEVAVENPGFDRIGDFHNNLCIAESYCGSGGYFKGKIYDVIIFDRTLSDDQIKALYNNPGLIQQ